MLPHVVIQLHRRRLSPSLISLLLMLERMRLLENGHFLLLTFSSPWCLLAIIIMMENAGTLHFSFPTSFRPSSPSRRRLCAATVPSASSLQFVVVLPLSPWGEVTPCLLVVSAALHCTRGGGGGGGFRLSKHLPAAAFPANTQSGISPFLSLRH